MSGEKELAWRWASRERLSEEQWQEVIEALPPSVASRARNGASTRNFVEAVLWVADTGASWTSLPSGYGDHRGHYVHFIRWANSYIWHAVIHRLGTVDISTRLQSLLHRYETSKQARDFKASGNRTPSRGS
jgi:hypothetical protein